jgi:hypothetical protein
MKRDMDLVRTIRLEIEGHELTGATFAVDVPDHSAEEVGPPPDDAQRSRLIMVKRPLGRDEALRLRRDATGSSTQPETTLAGPVESQGWRSRSAAARSSSAPPCSVRQESVSLHLISFRTSDDWIRWLETNSETNWLRNHATTGEQTFLV